MSYEDHDNAAINAMLQSFGLEQNNFKQVAVDFGLNNFIESDLNFRTAYISNEPYTLQKRGVPYNIYDPQDYGYNFYSDILFTSDELIEKEPHTVKDFYYASMKGWEYAYTHIDETITVILKYYNTQNKTEDALLYEAQALKKLAFIEDRPLGSMSAERLEMIVNTYKLLHLLQNNSKINFNEFIYEPNKQRTPLQVIHTVYSTLKEYQNILITLLLLVLSIPLISFYISYKLKKLLQQKSYALEKSYAIVNTNISISRTDLNGNITKVSKAFSQSTGYTEEELLGKNHSMFKDSNHSASKIFYKELWLTITNGDTWRGEFKNLNKDGSSRWVDSIIAPIFNEKGTIIEYESIQQDITIKKVLQEFNEKLEREVQEQTLEIKKNEKYLDTLFDINPNISYVLKNSKIQRVNKAFLSFTQFESLDDFLKIYSCICELFNENKNIQHNESCILDDKITLTYKNISYTFILTSKSFTINQEEIILITLEDISSLEKLATTDKLTSVFNRVKIDQEIEKNFTYYQDHNESFALILLDIDFFKNVNDTYGHQIGDEVLQQMSQLTQENIRQSDLLGRWGGEEFMVICPHTTKKEAVLVAQKIRKEIEKHHFPRIKKITISAGVSDVQISYTINSLIKDADNALYRAKKSGRNRVES